MPKSLLWAFSHMGRVEERWGEIYHARMMVNIFQFLIIIMNFWKKCVTASAALQKLYDIKIMAHANRRRCRACINAILDFHVSLACCWLAGCEKMYFLLGSGLIKCVARTKQHKHKLYKKLVVVTQLDTDERQRRCRAVSRTKLKLNSLSRRRHCATCVFCFLHNLNVMAAAGVKRRVSIRIGWATNRPSQKSAIFTRGVSRESRQ